jgi:RND family efflux transporter MFP subunit
VSGVLLHTFVTEGAAVTNGQLLFQIDPSDYAMRVRQVESLVAADRANLELNRLTLERNRPLFDKQLVAVETLDMLKTRLAAAEAQLSADEAALDQARLNLARCAITAPMAGVCSKRYLDNGNLAAAGMTRLINIRSYDPLAVEFSVSEQYLPLVRRSLAAGTIHIHVTPRGDTNSYEGKLDFVDNAVNALTGTILLRGQIPNPDLKLWARQFVQVAIHAGSIPDAVMVPEGAVQLGKEGAYLYTVSADNKAERRAVTTGVRCDNLIQIVTGVAPGDRVVAMGQLMLYPGAPVAEAQQQPVPQRK